MEIRPCSGGAELRVFEELPERLHGSDPWFVPPVPGSVRALFRQDHPVQQAVSMTPYLCWADGEPVGRIASIRNQVHERVHGDGVGFFGFFDFRDGAAAAALLERARDDMDRAGRSTLRGPYDPTANHPVGILVEGYRQHPALLTTWTPPYYREAYEGLGLEGIRDLYSYELRKLPAVRTRLGGMVARGRRQGLRSRAADPLGTPADLDLLHRLFNETLRGEWGFMPMARGALERGFRDLKPVMDRELLRILERGGEPVGLALGFPDVNRWLAELRGTPSWFRLPRLLLRSWRGRPRRARVAVFGVQKEFQGVGAAAVLLDDVLEALEAYPDGGEFSWVQDQNRNVHHVMRFGGFPRTRVHRVYELPLTGARGRADAR